MIDRNKGCALPAGRHIGAAQIKHHGPSQPLRERDAITKLHRQKRLGPVEHGLAMKPDDVDAGEIDGIVPDEGLDSLGMGARQKGFGLGQDARPRRSVGEQRPGVGQRRAQETALGVRIGPEAGRALHDMRLAIRLDERDVDAVHGGAGHEADGTVEGHMLCLSSDRQPAARRDRPATWSSRRHIRSMHQCDDDPEEKSCQQRSGMGGANRSSRWVSHQPETSQRSREDRTSAEPEP